MGLMKGTVLPLILLELHVHSVFWHTNWLNGMSPKNIAPALFRKSKRENFTVKRALQNDYWIDQIHPLSPGQEVREYTELWEKKTKHKRDSAVEDEIYWRWMVDGEYSTKSAYQIQLWGRRKASLGPMPKPNQNASSSPGFSSTIKS